MASGFSPWYKRLSYRLLPFLWKKCPAGNYHRRSDECCYCRCNEHVAGRDGESWHGGVYHFPTGWEIDVTKPMLPEPEWSPSLSVFMEQTNAYVSYVKKYAAICASLSRPIEFCVPEGNEQRPPSFFTAGELHRETGRDSQPRPVDDQSGGAGLR